MKIAWLVKIQFYVAFSGSNMTTWIIKKIWKQWQKILLPSNPTSLNLSWENNWTGVQRRLCKVLNQGFHNSETWEKIKCLKQIRNWLNRWVSRQPRGIWLLTVALASMNTDKAIPGREAGPRGCLMVCWLSLYFVVKYWSPVCGYPWGQKHVISRKGKDPNSS
jgi:hypothetical protein